MISKAVLEKLKQKNVSKDAEQTKERLREAWLSSKKPLRNEILSLAGLTKFAVRNSCQSGGISAKLTLAVSCVLKINPYFLTGESDWREDFSENVVRQFLVDKGYADLADMMGEEQAEAPVKVKRAYNRKKPVVAPDVEEAGETCAEAEEAPIAAPASDCKCDPMLSEIINKYKTLNENDLQKIEAMPSETAAHFLTGLLLRAEYSEEAKKIAVLVKMLLTL